MGATGSHPPPPWGLYLNCLAWPLSAAAMLRPVSLFSPYPQPRAPPCPAGSPSSLPPAGPPAPASATLPVEPFPVATACPRRLAGCPPTTEGHQARGRTLRGDQGPPQSSTPSTCREQGLAAWDSAVPTALSCVNTVTASWHTGLRPHRGVRGAGGTGANTAHTYTCAAPQSLTTASWSQLTWQSHPHCTPPLAWPPPLPHLRPCRDGGGG